MEEQKKVKSGRKTLTENQEEFCKLIVSQGMQPLEAMLKVFPNRKTYSKGNQTRLANEMIKNERINARLTELYEELRSNSILGDLYDFDKGVKILLEEIDRAQKKIEEGFFSESVHRIILTSIQELNRMYGFNITDKKGGSGGSMSITFVKVDKTEGDVKIG